MDPKISLPERSLSQIDQRVREGFPQWYTEWAPKEAGEVLRLLSSLHCEGVPTEDVGAVIIGLSSHPGFNMAALIKATRRNRADPGCAPFLNELKTRLLCPTSRDEVFLYRAESKGGLLAQMVGNKPDLVGLQNSIENSERALKRKLTDDERLHDDLPQGTHLQ